MHDIAIAVALALASANVTTTDRAPHAAGKIATSLPRSPDAPADRYFGPLRMSAIGIRMRIDLLGRRYSARSESDADLLHDIADVRTALEAWLGKYPNDAWAAPTWFHLAQLYADVQTAQARVEARDAFAYVGTHYASTTYGHLARLRLAQGFPPLHDESPLVATPAPSTAPSGVSTPGATALPTLLATPAPSASPQVTPAATPNDAR